MEVLYLIGSYLDQADDLAGIGGIATALNLGRRGHHVTILESAPKVLHRTFKRILTSETNCQLVDGSRGGYSGITEYGKTTRP